MAITVWEDRISPVFDSAQKVLIYSFENEEQYYIDLTEEPVERKIENLVSHNVSQLVCGAISKAASNRAVNSGIDVYPFVTGNIDVLIQCIKKGQFSSQRFRMPGCSCKRNRCRKGRRFKENQGHIRNIIQ